MMTNRRVNSERDSGETRVRKFRVDEVNIYEVKESELDELEKGNQADLFLEFAIFCISISFSAVISLFTATFNSMYVFNAFMCVAIIGGIIGFLLIILWYRGRKGKSEIINKIKRRGQINDEV